MKAKNVALRLNRRRADYSRMMDESRDAYSSKRQLRKENGGFKRPGSNNK